MTRQEAVNAIKAAWGAIADQYPDGHPGQAEHAARLDAVLAALDADRAGKVEAMTAEERAAEVDVVQEDHGDGFCSRWEVNYEATRAHIAAAIRAAVAEEREACAGEIDRLAEPLRGRSTERHDGAWVALTRGAAAIRARAQEQSESGTVGVSEEGS